MKIVNKNAALALFEIAEKMENQNRDGWQCIYFNIRDRQQWNNPLFSSNFDLFSITDAMAKNSGDMYLFENGDIFMLFNNRAKIIIGRLNDYLWSRHRSESRPTYYPFAIMDLSRDFRVFYKLSETRYLKAIAEPESIVTKVAKREWNAEETAQRMAQ